jgi:hypothetical protein
MGYKKSKAFEEIRIPMIVKMVDESMPADKDGNFSLTEVEVAHIFKLPTPELRQEWQRRLVKVKGRKVTGGATSDANWFLWLNCILKVEGYDDLPDGQNWKSYFEDSIGRIHVDNAIGMLVETIGSEEVEQEKKLEQSSAQ